MNNNDIDKLLQAKAVLAPMAGITDAPFRLLARKFGCEFAFTEMIDVNALVYNNEKTAPYRLFSYPKNGFSYLFGLRYLTNFDLTLFCEYHHDGAGMNKDLFKSYFDFFTNKISLNISIKAWKPKEYYYILK